MNKVLAALIAAALLAGCSLMPKSVEFGQDKVGEFPDHPTKQSEATRQAVALAAEKAREAEKLAAEDFSDAEKPAGEAAELSEAVGRALGPPAEPWKGEIEALKLRLDAQTAKYNRLLEKFAERNDENAGKKIEGTGFLQIPYFVWLFLVAAALFVGLVVLKAVAAAAAAANPGVAVGLTAAKVGSRVVSKGFSQLVRAGESFKNRLGEVVVEEGLRDQILEVFRTSHTSSQDEDVQNLIRHLTRKH